MSIFPFMNFTLGSFSGIASYKQQPVDYKLLATYFGIITPLQLIKTYSNLDVVSKIRLKGVKPYVHIPVAITIFSIVNGSVFGLGYVLGNYGFKALNG